MAVDMPTIGSTRVHGTGWREPVALAQHIIGPSLMARLGHVQFVLGVDPVFAGVHAFPDIADGRSYRDTAHCAYPFHIIGPADRRVTTIVMPSQYRQPLWTAHTLVHELGHALDGTLGFQHTCTPVTEYARTNRYEAFAEAFTSWCWPGNNYERTADVDRALFQLLEAGS